VFDRDSISAGVGDPSYSQRFFRKLMLYPTRQHIPEVALCSRGRCRAHVRRNKPRSRLRRTAASSPLASPISLL